MRITITRRNKIKPEVRKITCLSVLNGCMMRYKTVELDHEEIRKWTNFRQPSNSAEELYVVNHIQLPLG